LATSSSDFNSVNHALWRNNPYFDVTGSTSGDTMEGVYSKQLIALLFALLSAAGCAGTRLIVSDGLVALKPDQGILVVHVDSDYPIRKLNFNFRFKAAADLSAGEYVALLVVPAGNYHWTTIDVSSGFFDHYFKFRMRRDRDWSFKVEAGRINYPGQIIVKGSNKTSFGIRVPRAWTKNRPALALEQIRENYPTLITQYQLANGRSERDDFLDSYQRIAPFELPKTSEASPN
jgi:hypothetical protein